MLELEEPKGPKVPTTLDEGNAAAYLRRGVNGAALCARVVWGRRADGAPLHVSCLIPNVVTDFDTLM